jgi:hypothetical protein
LHARRADAHGEGGGARSDVSRFLQRLEPPKPQGPLAFQTITILLSRW